MPKFLLEASYTLEGLRGVRSEGGSARLAAVKEATESAGGKLEAMYFAFGDRDVYIIVDYPDNTAAAAVALSVNATGAVNLRTVVLLTPAEVDAAARATSTYRPPGA